MIFAMLSAGQSQSLAHVLDDGPAFQWRAGGFFGIMHQEVNVLEPDVRVAQHFRANLVEGCFILPVAYIYAAV